MPAAMAFVDGTPIDSVALHARAGVDALHDFGHTASFEDVRSQIGAIVGDMPYDAEAAAKSGLRTVGMLGGGGGR